MSSQLCLSVTFLSPYFHGRRENDSLEWPPSPLRLFQSLVSALASDRRLESAREALEWLEGQAPPVIIAPVGIAGGGYRLSVPNNSMDIVSRAWARGIESGGGDSNPATHRTMKTVKYTRILSDDEFPAVHYLWHLPDGTPSDVRKHIDMLSRASRASVVLGWGIDMIAGNGRVLRQDESLQLRGERWHASDESGPTRLRVPIKGTFADLRRRHDAWLKRMSRSGQTYVPTPPLTSFEATPYARAVDLPSRPVAAFSCLDARSGGFRVFSTTRQAVVVAGMARHATKRAAERSGWPREDVASFVLGHAEPEGSTEHQTVGNARYAFLPLASIETWGLNNHQVVGDIRRVAVFSFASGKGREIEWVRRALSGQDLVREGQQAPVAMLAPIPLGDSVLQHYVKRSATWATVTPVILPGYDDPRQYRRRLKQPTVAQEQAKLLLRLDSRIDALIRRAIEHAGFAQALARHAAIEWRTSGFWQGTERADRYHVPEHLKRYPRLHVRIHWRDETGASLSVPGPICLGGGRFCGIGLFAAP